VCVGVFLFNVHANKKVSDSITNELVIHLKEVCFWKWVHIREAEIRFQKHKKIIITFKIIISLFQ